MGCTLLITTIIFAKPGFGKKAPGLECLLETNSEYTIRCVLLVQNSLMSLMDEIQAVYSAENNAELYRLRVPLIGQTV